MKIILTNDIHMASKGPVTRTDDWPETVVGKLDQIAMLARKVHASAIGIAGDVFHLRSRTSYGILYRMIEWGLGLKRDGIDVLAIPGNHDEVFNRLDSIPTQALGLMFLSGAMRDVSYASAQYGEVAVVGVPYPDAQVLDNFRRVENPSGRGILMAHGFAGVQGGDFFGEPVLRYEDLVSFPFDVFHFGHDHRDAGVVTIAGKQMVNIGSLTRGSLSADATAREVKVAVVSYQAEGPPAVQQVRLAVKPAAEVFDLALKAQKDREQGEIEKFVGHLTTDLSGMGRVDFTERLGRLDLPEDVRRRVVTYLDAAETANE